MRAGTAPGGSLRHRLRPQVRRHVGPDRPLKRSGSGELTEPRTGAFGFSAPCRLSPERLRGSRLVDKTVRVAGCVPALQASLMHPQPAEVVAVREEPRLD